MRETNRISALREALASVSATLMLPEQVIRTLHSWVSCTSMGASACSRTECCQAKPMWDKLDRMIDGFFEGITLADLLHDSVTA